MGFFTSFVKNGEIRPSLCYEIILEQREERNQLKNDKNNSYSVLAYFGNRNTKT